MLSFYYANTDSTNSLKGEWSPPKIVLALRAAVWSKSKGGMSPLAPSPGSTTAQCACYHHRHYYEE